LLSVDQANAIINENKSNKLVSSLEEYTTENNAVEESMFENVVGQDSLTRFDKPRKKKNLKRRKAKKHVN
jgi:hypothetical protein